MGETGTWQRESQGEQVPKLPSEGGHGGCPGPAERPLEGVLRAGMSAPSLALLGP